MKSLIIKVSLFIKIWLLFFALTGCAPGNRLIFSPNIYASGNFGYYNNMLFYGTYFIYSDIVVKNGSSYRLEIAASGAEKIKGINLTPGQEETVSMKVNYMEQHNIVMTATAFTDKGKIYGTASQLFSFNGQAFQKRVNIWHIRNYDVQPISP